MDGKLRALIIAMSVCGLWLSITAIFKFFDVPFSVYGTYLLWLLAIVTFYYLLNSKSPQGLIFKHDQGQ